MNGDIPAFFRCRLWWFIPLLVWAGMTALSLHANLDDQRRHGFEVATEGIRHVFRMVVLTRAWNADHQGVYVPVTDTVQPNPYLKHRLRDLTTEQGVRLTMINPAYMTRQLSEMAKAEGEVAFHITSRKPLRPANAPDDWERQALDAFERGLKERIELVGTGGGRLLRYMAPLPSPRPACRATPTRATRSATCAAASASACPMRRSKPAWHPRCTGKPSVISRSSWSSPYSPGCCSNCCAGAGWSSPSTSATWKRRAPNCRRATGP
ncbi:DUF3365 domain-containing protein [Parasulfuritortus cantonensis]|uniref:DUF3365 domain-containing protein n=1 Tax=Parasulfuritortus cantonensis TaxID=2528202 RepID=A0A4R1B7W5_9PROT|nr:DUF3365 domain-containing protein [Parasulfuritortus cantonensis]TCJ11879.1 DUF3365 domain-containing protein [Parasulfuritortus cantonensis]